MATDTQLRKKIRCCKCGEIFTLLIETAGEPELSIACPYCGASLHINLAKYPKTETEIMRVAGDEAPKTVSVYVLPEVLETESNE
jgi:predicted  nucleic acid-binding Zn-ribbon protein